MKIESLVGHLGRESRDAADVRRVGAAEDGETRVGRRSHELHVAMEYRPIELAKTVAEVCDGSPAHRLAVAEGRVTDQLRGEVAERTARAALEHYGRVEKLSVVRDAGSVTADFKVVLERPLVVCGVQFRTGQTLIVEVKHGREDYCIRELRTVDSHARRQMAETVQREGADGAICMLPREMQNYRTAMEAIKADISNNERDRTVIWMGLPHAGAVTRAAEIHRAGLGR